MALRWVVGQLLTGKVTADISRYMDGGKWADQLNTAAPLSADVLMDNLYDFRTGNRSIGLRRKTPPWYSYLACIDTQNAASRVLAAGPIIGRPWDDEKRAVTLKAAGLWQYMYRRVLIPVYTSGRINKLVTRFESGTDRSLPDIAVGIVRQMLDHPSSSLPIDLPSVRIGGTNTRTYYGSDAALVGDRLKELVEVIGGPDVMFKPYLTQQSDGEYIRWRMVTGGKGVNPYIAAPGAQRFEYSAPENGITGLSIEEDSTGMASRAFVMGGDSGKASTVLAGQAFDQYLLDQGWPLLETVDDRSSVKRLATLDDYAGDLVAQGRTPVETWTVKFARNERPYLSTYDVGDFADLNVVNHPWIEDGVYRSRIVGLAGDAKDEVVDVTFQAGVMAQ